MSTTLLSGFVIKGDKMGTKEVARFKNFFFFLVNIRTIRIFLEGGERERDWLNMNTERRGRKKDKREKIDEIRSLRM